MRKFLALALCLVSCTTKMEQVGNVQYQPPKELARWKKTEMNQAGLEQTKYSHEKNDVEQMFITSHLSHPELDPATKKQLSPLMEFNQERVDNLQTELKNKLQTAFPNSEISIRTINMQSNSLFYEWTVRDQEGKVVSHSWERMFSTADGKTSLYYGYFLKGPEAKEPNTTAWIRTLQNASLKK